MKGKKRLGFSAFGKVPVRISGRRPNDELLIS